MVYQSARLHLARYELFKQKVLYFAKITLLKNSLSLLTLLIFFVACTKSKSPVGHAQFQNSSDDTYQAYIDGNAKSIVQAHSNQTFDISPGFHHLEAQQVSNTGLVETVTWDPYIPADQTALFAFP